ncbi:MAG: DUF86 domain-containing protein [Flavobacteriales bacterium]|nr:DUF86 domain-containing protein [Flavobacteriales bacterium]
MSPWKAQGHGRHAEPPIHSYDNVDDRIVWEAVRNHLPALKVVAQRQLAGS